MTFLDPLAALLDRLRTFPVCVCAIGPDGEPVGASVSLSLMDIAVQVDHQFVLDMVKIDLDYVTDGNLDVSVRRTGVRSHPGLILMAAPDHPLYTILDGMEVKLHITHSAMLCERFPVIARVEGPRELFEDLLGPSFNPMIPNFNWSAI